MKKLLSVVLALTMILSMSVTAFAADNNSHDVNASYTPTIAISDVALSEYSGNGALAIDTDAKTYTVTIPENQTEVAVTYTVSGTNLDKISADQTYLVSAGQGYCFDMTPSANITVGDDGTLSFDAAINSTFAGDLKFSNDGGTNWIDTGWDIVVKQADSTDPDPDTTAKITGLTISGVEKNDEGVYVIKADDQVTITVTGTNLDNLPETSTTGSGYEIKYAPSGRFNVYKGTSWTIADDGTSASKTYLGTEFKDNLSKYELRYKNGGDTEFTLSGVYVIYDDGISDEDRASIDNIEIISGAVLEDGVYVITPSSGDVTIRLSGENFSNLNDYYQIAYGEDLASAVSAADGWEIDTTNNVATKTIENSEFASTTTVFTIFYLNGGTTEDDIITSDVKLVYRSSYVGVDIKWGDMSFTYTDEGGWSATGNTVEVKTNQANTADAISVSAAFTGADGTNDTVKFDDLGITASWKNNENSATLKDNTTSCEFTLNLSGKPAKAFSGKIGTVTLTIEENKDAGDDMDIY